MLPADRKVQDVPGEVVIGIALVVEPEAEAALLPVGASDF